MTTQQQSPAQGGSIQQAARKEPKELAVTSTRHGKEPWEMVLCFQPLGKRDAFFWLPLSPSEGRALAAELMLVADETDARNAKLFQGGAA